MRQCDRELTERMIRGDESACDQFFEQYYPAVFRFAMRRLRSDQSAAEDVAQETLCCAIRKLRDFRGEAALLTWVCAICRNEIVAYHRRENRGGERIELVEDTAEIRAALESLQGVESKALAQVDRMGVAQIVHLALDSLPPHYGNALEWKYFDGESVVEIATRLGLSPKATESILTRARLAFKEAFSLLSDGAALPNQDPLNLETSS